MLRSYCSSCPKSNIPVRRRRTWTHPEYYSTNLYIRLTISATALRGSRPLVVYFDILYLSHANGHRSCLAMFCQYCKTGALNLAESIYYVLSFSQLSSSHHELKHLVALLPLTRYFRFYYLSARCSGNCLRRNLPRK